MTKDPSVTQQQRRGVYWQRVRRLTLLLLLAWFAVTFGILFFARELSRFNLFGWPFSFYMAAQGMVLIYLLIVGLYVLRMRRLDKIVTGEGKDGQ